ncbi:MAG TPA: nucleotide exchange factor GrpE [Candidatus Paceibacterota bacterium]
MVNSDNENDFEVEVTAEEDTDRDDPELIDTETTEANKIKQLREKLARAEEEKRNTLEAAQRERADFLNARKRLEAERAGDRLRYTKKHIEALLPLCDSFEMAISNTEAWEKADETWRKGMEGIHMQLKKLLESYGVSAIDPMNEPFDPYRHEAIGTVRVSDKDLQDKVVAVLQRGYEIEMGDKKEVIRPARVSTGEYTE